MPDHTPTDLQREDFEKALAEIGTYLDISVADLMEIASRARRHAWQRAEGQRPIESFRSQPS